MTSPGPYRTIARIRKPRDSGKDDPGERNDDPGEPETEGPDDPKASDANDPKASDANDAKDNDANDAKDDALDSSAHSLGTSASEDSRHTMARSRPNRAPKAPADTAAEESDEEQLKQDDAVKWYTDVLGFPKPSAKALYIDQTLTDVEILSGLSNKTIDAICNAVRKPGGAGKGQPYPCTGH